MLTGRRMAFRELTKAATGMGCTWHMVWRTGHGPAHFVAVLVDPYGQPLAQRIAAEPEEAAKRLTESILQVTR